MGLLKIWESFKEWLLPSSTFKESRTPKQDLACGRFLVAMLYLALTLVMFYMGVRLVYSGRVEVVRTGFKVDVVEAPSLAICPFFAKTSLIIPDSSEPSVLVERLTETGEDALYVEPDMCVYDRDCVCVNLYNVTLHDSLHNHKKDGLSQFRDRIAVTTTLMDPSSEQTLKVGLYDSVDRSPNWFYVNQGHYSIGQLELQVWTVTDMTFHSLFDTFRGDWTALARQRHIFRYTSQEVGDRGAGRAWNESTIIYEMKNFFVDETVSSETAFSVYTLGFLLFLVLARSWAIEGFFGALMPEWTPPTDGVTVRALTPAARVFWGSCCWCIFLREDKDGEQRPLRASSEHV